MAAKQNQLSCARHNDRSRTSSETQFERHRTSLPFSVIPSKSFYTPCRGKVHTSLSVFNSTPLQPPPQQCTSSAHPKPLTTWQRNGPQALELAAEHISIVHWPHFPSVASGGARLLCTGGSACLSGRTASSLLSAVASASQPSAATCPSATKSTGWVLRRRAQFCRVRSSAGHIALIPLEKQHAPNRPHSC